MPELITSVIATISPGFILGVLASALLEWSVPKNFMRAFMSVCIALFVCYAISPFANSIVSTALENGPVVGAISVFLLTAAALVISINTTTMTIKLAFVAIAIIAATAIGVISIPSIPGLG